MTIEQRWLRAELGYQEAAIERLTAATDGDLRHGAAAWAIRGFERRAAVIRAVLAIVERSQSVAA